MAMLSLLAASSSFMPVGVPAAPQLARAAAPIMAADRKFIGFNEDTIFEARELSTPRKP